MAVVGPGSQVEVTEDVKPLLEGANEFEYVTVLNPLSDDFRPRVAQDLPVNLPVQIRAGTGLVQSGGDVTRGYGIDLKNPDFQAKRRFYNETVIKAGQTINLKGNEAQVVVRQLVNEILQRSGKKRLMADPTLRREVEERVVRGRGSIQDLMEGRLQTPQAQVNAAIDKSNEVQDEQAFPDITGGSTDQTPEGSQDSDGPSVQQERRSQGRARKTE